MHRIFANAINSDRNRLYSHIHSKCAKIEMAFNGAKNLNEWKKNLTQNCQQADCVKHLFGQVILTPIRWWPNGIAENNKKFKRNKMRANNLCVRNAMRCLLPNWISNYISIFGHNTNNEIGYTEISSEWFDRFRHEIGIYGTMTLSFARGLSRDSMKNEKKVGVGAREKIRIN